MTIDQIAILLIIVMTFLLFIWGRLRYDIVSIIALGTLFIVDQVLGGQTSSLIMDGSNLFIGFAHPAVITVALVLIISRALQNAGVVELISRQIAPFFQASSYPYHKPERSSSYSFSYHEQCWCTGFNAACST